MQTSGFSAVNSAVGDPRRLDVLGHTALLDSPPEAAFDRLTRLASVTLNVPVALVSLVDQHRQFFKSQVGQCEPLASLREAPLSHSFCKHVVTSAEPLVVPDAREHPLLQDNPAIHESNVIAYLGIPLTTADGFTIGSFCAIDGKPREWQERDVRIMQDLASLVMTEVELRLLVRHFHANCLKLRNLELEREELVQMLVHDLRNPLSSLLLGLQVLESSNDVEQCSQSLATARKGAEHLSRMINDILDVSKSKAGRIDLNVGEVVAADLLRSACDLISNLATQAGVTVRTAITSDVIPFRADAEKLKRTLVNLISNAVQHTPRGGMVDIAMHRNVRAKQVVIEISDTGTGIPREAFRDIFEKFNQPRSANGSRASTGLGLPFCKMTVEAHGGRISVDSEVGQGTTFRVELPETPLGPKEKLK